MGTDIHLAVEWFDGSEWHSAHPGWKEPADDDWTSPWDPAGDWYSNRNYSLFAILANVRNGFGFAGSDSGDGFRYIAEPRGFPINMAPETAAWAETVEHTPSFLTLNELLDFDWTQVATQRGVLSAREFVRWDGFLRERGRRPQSYSLGISGPSIEIISEDEARVRFKDTDWRSLPEWPSAEARTFVRCQWEEPYFYAAEDWWSQMMPRLIHLSRQTGVEDVRIVFYFDS